MDVPLDTPLFRLEVSGFGPFPGCPVNPSATLAASLAATPFPRTAPPTLTLLPVSAAHVAAYATSALLPPSQPTLRLHLGGHDAAQLLARCE